MPKTGTLTKAPIFEAVAETNGYTQKKAFETVEIMLELIKRSLEFAKDVLISGFGKFCVKKSQTTWQESSDRCGHDAGSKKVVLFRCSRMLREKISDS